MIDYEHQPFDTEQYFAEIQARAETKRCFICELVAGENPHEVIYENEQAIVFFNKYPTQVGYVLVAPRQHLEEVTGDFTLPDYLELQTLIYQVAEALRAELQPERVYLCSLGSQQANSHVHWHVVPLPYDVPFEDQQSKAMSFDSGVLDIPPNELRALGQQLQQRILAMRNA